MEIEIVWATPHPIDAISYDAGVCYGKRDYKPSRVWHCYRQGHKSVLEHASVSVVISGISRACCNQLTRYRHASFCQESNRYVEIPEDDWYVIPPSFEENERYTVQRLKETMRFIMLEYQAAIMAGIPPEDARYIASVGSKTSIAMTLNVAELYHIMDQRLDRAAQWEIRNLIKLLQETVRSYNAQWREIIEIWESNHERSRI